MSVRNGTVLLLALSALTLLSGCGSSNNTTATPPPSGSFSKSDLNGTYVFSVSGTDTDDAPYSIVGAFIANGSGGITGGSIDIADAEFTPAPDLTISGNGQYTVGVDGRGQVTIGTTTANPFGSNLTFDFVLSTSSSGLITEFDDDASGSGTLDLQASGTTATGTYAFSFTGLNLETDSSFATVGNFTIGAGGSITGLEDFNSGGIPYADQSLTGQVVVGPSTTPSTVLSTESFADYTYDVYAIDATHLKFIETDGLGTLSGDAFSQTSSTISGTLAFTMAGLVSNEEPFAAGGFMVTDGNGNITTASTEDVNEGGVTVSSPSSPIAFSATYAPGGSGRFTISNFANFIPSTPDETQYAAYPSSGGLLLLEIDDLGTATGAAYPQSSTIPTFASAEGYGLNLTGTYLGANTDGQEEEVDDIAEFTATSGALTGLVDENYAPSSAPLYGLALSDGTYTGPDANGRYVLASDAGNSSVSTLNGGFQLTYYSVDGTNFPFIESDPGQVAVGVIVLQTPTATSAVAKPRAFITRPLIRPRGNFKKRANK
jgi:hypothetical protein